MTDLIFKESVEDQLARCANVLINKGMEYAPCGDRLRMFKTAGKLQGITAKQALLGMAAKHLVSIANMCMDDGKYSLDHWREKITDSMNYMILLEALVEEEEHNEEYSD